MGRSEESLAAEAERKLKYNARKWAMAERAKPQMKSVTETEVPVESIDVGPAASVRAELNADAVREYGEASDLPPIDVCEGGGKWYLGDGRHRLEAKRATGKKKISAKVYRYGTAEEARTAALLLAFAANSTHGLPRTAADKRAAVRACLSVPEYADQSDRRIAEMCRVGHWMVGQVRAEMTADKELTGSAAKGSAERPKSGNPSGQQKPTMDGKPTGRATTRTEKAKVEPPPVLAPEPEPQAEPKKGERPKDARGRAVPDSMVPLFAAGRVLVNDCRAMLAEMLAGIKSAAEEPWGGGLPAIIPTLEADLSKTGTDIAASVPYCVCPHVTDAGEHQLGGNCKVCVKNRGWLTRHNYHQLSDAVKALIEEVAQQ
jgi:uncharacterized ParB-like nuclease family protein